MSQAAGPPADSELNRLNREVFEAFKNRQFQTAEMLADRVWEQMPEGTISTAVGIAAANKGALLTIRGRFEDAMEWQERADRIFGKVTADRLRGRLEVARAVTSFLNERQFSEEAPEQALQHVEAARPALGKDDFRLNWVEAEMMGHSPRAVHVQGSYMKYLGLIRACESSGDSLRLGWCEMRLGIVEGATGGHSEALKRYGRALEIFEAMKDSVGMGLAMRNMGLASRKKMMYDEAETILNQALVFSQKRGDTALSVKVLNDLSKLYMETGDFPRAAKTDQMVNTVLDSIGEDVRSGRSVDSLILDYHHLIRLRYASLLPYENDRFTGFYDQLVLEEK
ncbi:MAG: tetratricopeptide repeat protein [bacterium]|nr:tetratricopeptide repeat protein [bacterium]